MSSRTEPFLCHWRPSRRLLALYLGLLGLLALAGLSSSLPLTVLSLLLGLALLHAGWLLSRTLLPGGRYATGSLRHDAEGWWLRSGGEGWQPIQLRPGTLVLPALVVLQYRQPGQWFDRALCLPADSLDTEAHRRLRVRLRFARASQPARPADQTGR